MKIFIQSSDADFIQRLQLVDQEVETVAVGTPVEQVGKVLRDDDLFFVEQMPVHGFYHLRAHVVVIGAEHSRSEELMAARLGAKGFVVRDIPQTLLVDVIRSVTSGVVWMSRETIAHVFDEFAGLMNRDLENRIGRSGHK